MEKNEKANTAKNVYEVLLRRKEELHNIIERHRTLDIEYSIATKATQQIDNILPLVKFQVSISEMNKSRVVSNLYVHDVYSDDDGGVIEFKNDNGVILTLESVETSAGGIGTDEIDVSDLDVSDFDGLGFTFKFDDLGATIEKVKDSGIRIKPDNGHPVFIPCRNGNGLYGDNTILVLRDQFWYGRGELDITECLAEVEEEE